MLQPDRERLAPHVRAAVDASLERYGLEQAATAPSRHGSAVSASPAFWAMFAAVCAVLVVVLVVVSGPAGPAPSGPLVVVTPSLTPGPCPSGGVLC